MRSGESRFVRSKSDILGQKDTFSHVNAFTLTGPNSVAISLRRRRLLRRLSSLGSIDNTATALKRPPHQPSALANNRLHLYLKCSSRWKSLADTVHFSSTVPAPSSCTISSAPTSEFGLNLDLTGRIPPFLTQDPSFIPISRYLDRPYSAVAGASIPAAVAAKCSAAISSSCISDSTAENFARSTLAAGIPRE